MANSRWVLDATSLKLYDGSLVDYGAPSGPGITCELGSDGSAFFSKSLTIKTSKAGARIELNAAAAIEQIFDPTGQVRVQEGNLPVLGTSPAQWGFRAIDANNNPIFDSQGLIKVTSLLGTGADVTSDTYTSTTFTVLAGMTVTFSLARPAIVLFSAIVMGKTAGAGGQFALCDLFIDGVDTYRIGFLDKSNPGFMGMTDTHFTENQLAAGSHTIDVRISVDSGQTFTNNSSGLYVYLVGG